MDGRPVAKVASFASPSFDRVMGQMKKTRGTDDTADHCAAT
jgi:hypothetical protein